MSFVTPTWGQLLLLPGVVLLFLAPGWLLSRRWPTPAPLATAWLGSAALLFALALGLDALGIPLRASTLGPGFIALSLALLWRWPAGTPLLPRWRPAGPAREDWPWLLPAVLAAASLAGRTLLDPLSGYDNTFRWDYLARLFLLHESLAGYPPVSAADFEAYSWCDGIPPLVPLLNAWLYAGTGSIAPVLINARVWAEAALLGLLVHRLARRYGGERAGLPALAVLAASALAVWAVAIGQETALLTVALLAMIDLLEEHRQTPRTALWVWASVAAGVAAATREYGLAFPLLGLVVMGARNGVRAAVRFAGPAALVCGPWYLRNWIVTGNPVYPHPAGGLFPGHAVHEEMQRAIARFWATDGSHYPPSTLLGLFAVLAGLPVVLGAIGLVRARSRAGFALAAIVVVGLLWFWSIRYTAGGWAYSMRVLLPAVALLAAFAGGVLTSGRPVRGLLAVFVALVATDAARRAWMLPAFPFTPALSTSFADWRTMHDFATSPMPYRLWTELAGKARGGGVIVDHPAHHSILTLCGGRAVPLVSPALAPAFDEHASFATTVAKLRTAGIRYATLTPANPITAELIQAHRFWQELRRHRPNGGTGLVVIYDLDQLQP